jgi:transposase
MLEGDEVVQQDANIEESSAASQTSPDSANEVTAAGSSNENRQAASESQMPFHEHPRFKELISERNTFKDQIEAMQKQMEAMQGQKQQAPSKEHPFVARLKEIDPSYGEWAGNIEQMKKDFEELRTWKQEQARQSLVNEYNSSIEKLHSDNKVPEQLRARIKKEIDYLAMTNNKLGMKDLPNVYKQVLEEETKFLEGIKRSERAAYVTDKSKDSKAPQTQTKGAAPGQKPKQQSMDREERYAAIVKNALKNSKAGSDF